MIVTHGDAYPLGATCIDGGVNFALFSGNAEEVRLCLFDDRGAPAHELALPGNTNGVWHGFVPGCEPGQRYGYRVHGAYRPSAGLRFNPHKLLLDPYARELHGQLRWHDAVFGYRYDDNGEELPDTRDSAAYVPKGVVRAAWERPAGNCRVPWKQTVFYETHPRGFTMTHPALDEAQRGTFDGMSNAAVVDYLKALGVTSVELLPVHAFIDEKFLVDRKLRNYWGYNTLSFFAPHPRYLGAAGIESFRDMTRTLHDAGIEVILDVVYNHTAEGNHMGPTLSLRGIDNPAYYRLSQADQRHYIDDTGCGNTINIDHPRTLQLVLDSLRYWADGMGVDGFRFDLASVLGRTPAGFSHNATFFAALSQDPILARTKVVAEPWDVGPGGYQLGSYPQHWGEWNDRFRDTTRKFWRGDAGVLPEFARRVHGSSDIFEGRRRRPWASVNYVASHDGYTTADLVAYVRKHNAANGEENRDGHNANFSCNYGTEGATRDARINALRRRQRLNLLASVLLAQGTPMLLAGDEFGNSQHGNNNAYAQDNAIGWLDWSDLARDPEFQASIARLIHLRRTIWLLRQRSYVHGMVRGVGGFPNIDWLGADGAQLPEEHWKRSRHLTMFLSRTDDLDHGPQDFLAVAIMFNAEEEALKMALPRFATTGNWHAEFYSGEGDLDDLPEGSWTLQDRSMALFVWRHDRRTD